MEEEKKVNKDTQNLDSDQDALTPDEEAELDKLLSEDGKDNKDTEEKSDKPKYTDREKALYARAKKAEAKAKLFKKSEAELKPNISNSNTEKEETFTREEVVLLAKGIAEEDLELLKKIKEVGRYKTLLEAQNDKIYTLNKEKREKEEKNKKAQIGSTESHRSGKQGFDTAGLSREELKKLFNKLTNQ